MAPSRLRIVRANATALVVFTSISTSWAQCQIGSGSLWRNGAGDTIRVSEDGWSLFYWTKDGTTYQVDTGAPVGAREPPTRMVRFQNGILSLWSQGQPSDPVDQRTFYVDGVEYRPVCK